MNKATILNKHIEFKKTSVSSLEKIKDIERYIGKFLNSTTKTLEKITENDLAKFINSLDYSISTINNIKVYLKVFIKWYYPDWSSRFRNLDKLCRNQKPSRTYEPEDMISLKDFKKIVEGEKDLMFKVFWMVFFFGGFRPSECCRLKWENIYFEKEGVIIKLHTTKNNKDFYKSLPPEAEVLLKQWKEYNQSIFLFPSQINEGDCIKARSVCARLKRLSKRTLNRDVVPYALRHSVATILYQDDNRKDDDTAKQLGHNKSMKETYMNLDEGKIKARARMIWVKPDKLPPEKKHELELKIENLNQELGGVKLILNKICSGEIDISNPIKVSFDSEEEVIPLLIDNKLKYRKK